MFLCVAKPILSHPISINSGVGPEFTVNNKDSNITPRNYKDLEVVSRVGTKRITTVWFSLLLSHFEFVKLLDV